MSKDNIKWPPNPKSFNIVLKHYAIYEPDAEYKIICPFHEDINPSMIVNRSSGSYFCFGCSKGGDAFDLVKSFNKKSDDLKNLIKYFKILNGKDVSNEEVVKLKSTKEIKKEKRKYKIEANQYYYGLKTHDWYEYEGPEKEYLKNRGFTSKILNIAKAKVNINENYPIIFPLMDNNTFKGWVCRTTSKVVEAKRKYLYNKGFKRSNCLAGTYKSKTILVVEGYMDMLKAKQLGFKNVVALLGWKASNKQIEKLKKAGVKNIISALDNDECGNKGTKYLRQFFNVIKFKYPEGVKDMGDMKRAEANKIVKKIKLKIKKLRRLQKWG